MLLALGDHAGATLSSARLQHEVQDARRSTIRVLAEAVAARDPVLHRETSELAVHAGLLADELGLDQATRDVLICATLLRAVGCWRSRSAWFCGPGRSRPTSGC